MFEDKIQQDIDSAVKPTDDFFRYVNGAWLDRNPIPDNESRWGSFVMLGKETKDRLRQVLDELKDAEELNLHEERLVRDMYVSALANAEEGEPTTVVRDLLFEIESADDATKISRVLGVLHAWGITPFWATYVSHDAKDTSINALHFVQSGIGLPDRDYYLKDDEYSVGIREQYARYMQALLQGANLTGVIERERLFGMERALAESSMTRVEMRDPEGTYNPMTRTELEELAPHVAWSAYFDGLGAPEVERVIVGQPEFMKAADRMFEAASIGELRSYLVYRVFNEIAGYMGGVFEDWHFEFYGKQLSGAQEMKPLWERRLAAIQDLLPIPVGRVYVERFFSADAKHRVEVLVSDLVDAYRERILALDWMSEETKQSALVKLENILPKLGYPDKWRDFSELALGRDSFVRNALDAQRFEMQYMLEKLSQPATRDEWYMSPALVNAYYNPPTNEITFPAAILQPPFFDMEAPYPVNYGAIGVVIGHEITHGFDDKGSQYDEKGNIRNWWTEDDRARFMERAKVLVEQFNACEPFEGMHVNGELTLGENIADLGGYMIAFDALRLRMERDGRPEEAQYTAEQLFFLGGARMWRMNIRDELAKQFLRTDPHSPADLRVNVPFSNIDSFYEAFECSEGDDMYRPPEERARVW